MTGEVRFAEITTVKDGLLDSQVAHNKDSINGALQSQWQVIRDGMAQGASTRVEQAKDDPLLTGVEIAGSFGLGAGMSWALKAGGRWTQAAEIAGVAMLGVMGVDLTRRAANIQEAYAHSNGETALGQALRKDAIAQYAGAGLVDYSLMFASGGLGAKYGPRMGSKLATTLEPLTSRFTTMEPALQPALATNFRMDLAETGRLGAKEKIAPSADPITAARERLDFPHRSVGLDQLSSLMEAKQIAAHPEVRPIFEQMADSLGKVDKLKPLLSHEEQALAALDKQAAEIKALKPELQAVRHAENNFNAAKADVEKIPGLREQQSALSRQIQELKTASKDGAKKTDAEPALSEQALRTQRREVSDQISSIQSRAQELPTLEQRFTDARAALETRKSLIEGGKDPALAALEVQMQPLRESIAARKAELGTISEQLAGLDKQYQAAADAVKPTLKDLDGASLASNVPRYTKPKVELPDAPAKPKKAAAEELPKPPQQAKPPEAKSPVVEPKPPEAKVAAPAEPKAAQPPKQIERKLSQPERRTDAKTEAPEPRPVTEQDVNRALSEAKQAVDDFAATHKRHTTALKKLNDYIERSFSWLASDKAVATNAANARNTVSNVDAMLGKLENWDRAPGWIRAADRAQIMQRNGFDAATMERFDRWFQTQNKPLNQTSNMMPEERLMEVQQHLERRVAVESVKNFLRTAGDVQTAVSPIVQEGFSLVASGKLPDGRVIPKGSDMIVFEQRKVRGPNGEQEVILPFAKDGQHIQRFDDFRIAEGLRKLQSMKEGGPQALAAEDLYGFRLDHDPSRLMASNSQVGYAILRPGGQFGKNILYMNFAEGIDPAAINIRADVAGGKPGTNTGVLYNMLKSVPRNGGKQ